MDGHRWMDPHASSTGPPHNDRASQLLFATTTTTTATSTILITFLSRGRFSYAISPLGPRYIRVDKRGRFVESDEEYNGRIVEEKEKGRERERERGNVVDPNHTEYAERVWCFEDGQDHAPGSRVNDKKDDLCRGRIVVVVVMMMMVWWWWWWWSAVEQDQLGTGHDGPATAPALRLRRSLALLLLPPLSPLPSPFHCLSLSRSLSLASSTFFSPPLQPPSTRLPLFCCTPPPALPATRSLFSALRLPSLFPIRAFSLLLTRPSSSFLRGRSSTPPLLHLFRRFSLSLSFSLDPCFRTHARPNSSSFSSSSSSSSSFSPSLLRPLLRSNHTFLLRATLAMLVLPSSHFFLPSPISSLATVVLVFNFSLQQESWHMRFWEISKKHFGG
ncbi:uncharacterized protein LOC116185388 [Apis dorsata]|uniref:uncharacterized protein LOC116185388 n=1 Tax=Apis dorsata TaxID=7462 RepID=UPI0012934EEB|nr:uncharacterized protein LOC116185388 [Apis dorsata]